MTRRLCRVWPRKRPATVGELQNYTQAWRDLVNQTQRASERLGPAGGTLNQMAIQSASEQLGCMRTFKHLILYPAPNDGLQLAFRFNLLPVCIVGTLALGCSGSNGALGDGTGGSANVSSAGGAASSGGAVSAGGATSSSSNVVTGGTGQSGGSPATGGTRPGTGGSARRAGSRGASPASHFGPKERLTRCQDGGGSQSRRMASRSLSA